jgi:hypothetical protein
MVCASAKCPDAFAVETDEELAAPKLTKTLSGSGRSLLASISSGEAQCVAVAASAAGDEEIPAAIPLRRTLTKNSGAVFDRFVSKDRASVTSSLETAAGVLRRAADAERLGQISHRAKLQVQQQLLCCGVGDASRALEAALAAGGSASTSAGAAAAIPAVAALLPVQEKSPKKRKKKQGYADMMAVITAPTVTEAEKQQQLERRLREGLGGGQFSKLDRI